MGYVTAGRGRMTILSPDGSLDTYPMTAGDMYFVPRAYPHHIENIAGDELPFWCSIRTSLRMSEQILASAFSREVLAATFQTDPEKLPKFPFTAEDPLIVDRINPVDGTAGS